MFKAGWFATLVLAVTLGFAAFAAAPSASAEEMGSTCADCPTYKGKYSVENTALFTIEYQYRWGKDQEWRTVVLSSGARKTHSKFLGYDSEERIPRPYVRWRKTNGDWSQVHKMNFFAVVADPGYGGKKKGQPFRYLLTYTGDFQAIDLVEDDENN